MDQILKNQLQFYTPPHLIQQTLTSEKKCYEVAQYIIDKDFKHRPQRWKTVALPDYLDFFQAAVSGFNPYKESSGSKDKGLLQAIKSYDPHKRLSTMQAPYLLLEVGGVEQALCPHCDQRGEVVSFWPTSAGNTTVKEGCAPEPVFHKNDKYCGRQVDGTAAELEMWEEDGLIRPSGKKFLCNYPSRLACLKNYIVGQINFLIKDIRSAEYHRSRSLRRHPFYPCPKCDTLNPDFNTSTVKKTTELKCTNCSETYGLEDFKGKLSSKIVWQARGATSALSFSDHSNETDGRSTYEDVVVNYSVNNTNNDQAVFHNVIEEEKTSLFADLISRIRELSASSLSKKQHERLMADPAVLKIDGIPETQNFKIFYEYFFIDDIRLKQEHSGKVKDKGDESSTYRDLAFKYLRKEQHYTQCQECQKKMYEPTESAKFKKLGHSTKCTVCESIDVVYHGPKCGTQKGINTTCTDHNNVEVVMYIFQTIEPKIRRLEELVKNDKKAIEINDRIQELLLAKDDMDSYQDMVKLLNY